MKINFSTSPRTGGRPSSVAAALDLGLVLGTVCLRTLTTLLRPRRALSGASIQCAKTFGEFSPCLIGTRACLQFSAMAAMILLLAMLPGVKAAAAESLVEFNFDEGSGNTVKSKAGNLIGSMGAPIDPANEPIVVADAPSGATTNKAVKMNGLGFLVALDTPTPIFRIQTNAFTLEAWINIDPADARTFVGIVAYGGAYKMGLRNNELIFTLFTVVDIPSGFIVPPGEWHHVAAVWEPGTGVTFYLDGVPNSVAETRNIPAPLNTFLNVGAERLSNGFMGSLDRLRIHKAVLTAEQLDTVKETPKAPLASTLAAYNFNEAKAPFGSGTTPDRPAISYQTYLAQNSSPTFSTDTPSRLPGDYSLQFATGQRVVVPDPKTVLALDPDDSSFTIQAWLKFATPAARSVFFYNNAPGGAVSASVFTNRTAFVTTLGIVDQRSTAVIPDDKQWHHMAVVHEFGTELRFYVDGVLKDTVPYTRGTIFTRTNLVFYLGSESTGGLQYVGLLDRFRYSKGALTAEELDSRAVPAGQAVASLGISRTDKDIKISWPTAAAGFVLQQTTDLTPPRTWVNVATAPTSDNVNNTVSVPISGPQIFYRLIKP